MEQAGKKYYQFVHFWGRLTLTAAIAVFLGICFFLSFGLGHHPGWANISTAFLGVAAMVGHTWVNVGDQITYILLMGPAATYMSCLTGNIKNMRLPSAMAAAAAIEDGDAAESSPKRDILATIGVCASIVVNTSFLLVLALGGARVLRLLPDSVMRGLNYIVPALFGAIFAQFMLMSVRTAAIALAVILLVYNLSFIPSFIQTFVCILVVIAVNVLLYTRKKSGTQESGR